MNDGLETVLERFRQIGQGFLGLLPNLLIALVVFGMFALLAGGLRRVVNRVAWRSNRQSLGLVLGRLTHWTVLLIGLLVALSVVIPSFQAGDLVQLLGISSVAIGFAFRDILQNFLAGILLLLTEPFRLGDQIVVGSFEGTVENIETRATTIRTYDGRRVVIPNANLFTQSVTVNTAFEHRRLEFELSIGYNEDLARTRSLILEAVREVPGVLHDPPPDAIVIELDDSGAVVRARWWVQPLRQADALDARNSVLEAVKTSLQAHGIGLPFPTTKVLIQNGPAPHEPEERTASAR